ncbi:MAG: hypothetical protein IPG08_01325 [Sphingobacteriaceae bacterium]|nr:hypothetical protein [Sphingobacteriaceae bacterium]
MSNRLPVLTEDSIIGPQLDYSQDPIMLGTTISNTYSELLLTDRGERLLKLLLLQRYPHNTYKQ